MSRRVSFRIQGLVTHPGQHGHRQDELARLLCAQLGPSATQACRLVEQVFEASGIRQRHLELSPSSEGAHPLGATAISRAGLDLSTRALGEALEGVELASPCALLTCTDAPAPLHAGLAARLAGRFDLPAGSILRDFVGPTPREALVFGQRLLAHGLARDVLVLTLSTRGSLEWSEPLTARPSLSEVLERCSASDAAALLHLSSVARPGSLLRYRELSSLPIPLSAGEPLPPALGGAPFDWRSVSQHWLADLRRWLEGDASERPTLLVSGGLALPFLLAEQPAPRGRGLEISRELYREHGDLGIASTPFALQRALRESLPLSPDLRFVALEPGAPSSMVLLGGVDRDPEGADQPVAARRM